MKDVQKTLLLTQELELTLNFSKSQMTPTQKILYLGVLLDSLSFRASPSQE